MSKVDVLIVNPPSPDGEIYIRDVCRWGRKSREGMVWPQTSLAYLAAMIPEGMSVEIIDAIAEKINWESFKNILQEKKPHVYVSYVTGTTMGIDAEGIKAAGNAGAVTIAIGPHPSAIPQDTLERIPELDIVIRHEPEITFNEILKKILEGKEFNKCPGTATRDKTGSIIINKDRPLIKHLDELPIPKHHLLPLDKYKMPFLGKRYAWVLTNRGCPYQCTFCFESILWGSSVRFRSPKSIHKELIYLDKLNVHNILFMADLFTLDRKAVLQLCDLILESGLKIRWICNSRVDTIDEEMAAKMKEAGCYLIAVGIESGSQKILDACRKDADVNRAYETVNLIHKTGIKSWGYFMLGLPEETKNTIADTVRLAKNLPLNLVLFHIAVPYPGTEFYTQAAQQGWLRSTDWTLFDMNDSAVVGYPSLSPEDLVKETKAAYRKFYLRPRQIWRLIRMATSSKDFFTMTRTVKSLFLWIFSKNKK